MFPPFSYYVIRLWYLLPRTLTIAKNPAYQILVQSRKAWDASSIGMLVGTQDQKFRNPAGDRI